MLNIRGNLILILFWIAGTESLRCPTCTYLTTDELVQDGTGSVLNTILGKSHQPECAQDLKETVPEIKEEICENKSGQAPRCIYYNGSLTITLSTSHVSNVSFPLQLHYRGCLNKILDNLPSDGCYQHMNLLGDELVMASLLENIDLSQTVWKSMLPVFTGIRCLCSRSFCPGIQMIKDTPTSNTTSLTTTTTKTTNNTQKRKADTTELVTQPSAVKGSNCDIILIVFTVFLTGTL